MSAETQEYCNLYLYGALPPNLRSQLSPLPTDVWELEGITLTPTTTSTPASTLGRVGGAADTGSHTSTLTLTLSVSESIARRNANTWPGKRINGAGVKRMPITKPPNRRGRPNITQQIGTPTLSKSQQIWQQSKRLAAYSDPYITGEHRQGY